MRTLLAIPFAIALLVTGAAFVALSQIRSVPPEAELAWMCPMHPDYTQPGDAPGEHKCPKCGMALVQSNPFDVRDYELDFQTTPKLVRAGRKANFQFRVLPPDAAANAMPVQRFEPVHERQYHLFVISQDMQHFEHIHPTMGPGGVWSIDVTLPKPGYYKVLSDFLPSGGTSQFIARPLVTANFTGDLASSSAKLVPETKLTKTEGDITATISYDPQVCLVGLYCHLNYTLTDTATGKPITDLQTYLGAFGHTLIMSEDMVDYVHSHPLDIVTKAGEDGSPPEFLIKPGDDLEKLRGGPTVTFEGLMPKPGRYRAFTQFRRNNKVHTFAFTFKAVLQ